MISRNSVFVSVKNLIVVVTICVSLAGFLGSPVEASEPLGVDEKVKVELYYESQCPGCRALVTNSFSQAFQTEGFLDMAEVEFVPFGNAKETKNADGTYEFECQHGPSECIYNTIEACALAKIDDPLLAFRYIDCIERSDESRDPEQDFYKVAITCCELTNLPENTVSQMEECAMGLEGIQLEHEAATKTEALDPPHAYVPYVVVNGEYDDKVQDAIMNSLFNYVCDAYLGSNKSPSCPAKTTLRAGTSLRDYFTLEVKEVCYRRDGTADASKVAEK